MLRNWWQRPIAIKEEEEQRLVASFTSRSLLLLLLLLGCSFRSGRPLSKLSFNLLIWILVRRRVNSSSLCSLCANWATEQQAAATVQLVLLVVVALINKTISAREQAREAPGWLWIHTTGEETRKKICCFTTISPFHYSSVAGRDCSLLCWSRNMKKRRKSEVKAIQFLHT